MGTAAIVGGFVRRLCPALACLFALVLTPAAAAAQALTLSDLLTAGAGDVARVLESSRPAAQSVALRERVLTILPNHGSSSSAPIPSPASRVPANLLVHDYLAPRVTSMWHQSPTFRRQCARLAEHPHVIVRLALVDEVRGASARSRVRWRDGALNVSVQIDVRKPALFAEYIAHELEHVLEQVDGRDLPLLAANGLDGVEDLGGSFETARARSVGRLVASEVRRP